MCQIRVWSGVVPAVTQTQKAEPLVREEAPFNAGWRGSRGRNVGWQILVCQEGRCGEYALLHHGEGSRMRNRQEGLLLHLRQVKAQTADSRIPSLLLRHCQRLWLWFRHEQPEWKFCAPDACEVRCVLRHGVHDWCYSPTHCWEGRSLLLQQVWLSSFAGVLRVWKSSIAESFTSHHFSEERHQRMLPELICHFCHAENPKGNGPRGANRGSLSDFELYFFQHDVIRPQPSQLQTSCPTHPKLFEGDQAAGHQDHSRQLFWIFQDTKRNRNSDLHIGLRWGRPNQLHPIKNNFTTLFHDFGQRMF